MSLSSIFQGELNNAAGVFYRYSEVEIRYMTFIVQKDMPYFEKIKERKILDNEMQVIRKVLTDGVDIKGTNFDHLALQLFIKTKLFSSKKTICLYRLYR